MKKIAQYQPIECLYRTNCLSVYRANCDHSAESVVLKVVDKESCEADSIEQIRNEQELLQQLSDVPGVPEFIEFIESPSQLVLVVSDFHGITLSQALEQNLSIDQIVDALSQCVKILAQLHRQHIIHKDIKPSNIIWQPETERVQLIDYGLAVRFDHSLNNFYQFGSMDGSLCYMPPEQTGRVNRQVDYRSDYYSLGMTAYELLCQEKPFTWSADSDEILYAILAIEPPAPHHINDKVPKSLSNIVMRLIAKDAEDRYQTNRGLLHDLSQALSQDNLQLGQLDVRSQFQAPNKVYGREQELKVLKQALRHIAQGYSQRVFISGFSGVGKTSIARELYGDIQKANGYVIEGKFDQLQRNQPLFALTQAFDDFFAAILVESDLTIRCWQDKLKQDLGDNIAVMARLIPNLEYLVEIDEEPLYLAGEEGLNRLVFAFLRLIKLVASAEKPLVIFIDDLQWMDLASVMLIDALFRSDDIKHVLFIGAYRDNEVDKSHNLTDLMHLDTQSKWPSHALALSNLTQTDIQAFIVDGFQQRISQPELLTEYLHKKTAGNPFFTIQLINKLIEDDLISLCDSGCWHYKLSDLEQLAVADSVVALMLKKLEMLPQGQREILKIAAAIGHEFTLSTLAIITEKSEQALRELLLHSIHSGFILASEHSFAFAHDGIQQAAYNIGSKEHTQALHLKIGQHLLDYYNDKDKDLEREVFDICFHLNQCAGLINQQQRQDLIQLNVLAIQTANRAAAYAVAFAHAKTIIELIEQWGISGFADCLFQVYKEAAESAYLSGEHECAETYFSRALELASGNFEYCQIINLRVIQLIALGQYEQSFSFGIKALQRYQIELPEVDDDNAIAAAYQTKAKQFQQDWLEKGNSISQLYDLPSTKDPEITLVMELLGSLYASALMSFSNYQKVLTMELVNLSVKYGNTSTSPIAYAWHGSTINAISEQFDQAYEFGQLAIKLNEQKIQNSAIACKIYNMVANFISPFKEPLKDSLPSLRHAYSLGLESGDKLYASYSIINELRTSLSTGMPLHKWLAYDQDIVLKLQQCDGDLMIQVRESFRSYAMLMAGKSHSLDNLNNDDFNEQAYRETYQQVPLFGCLLDAWKIQSCVYLGQFEQALALALTDSSAIDSFVLGIEKHFFAALTALYFIDHEPNHQDLDKCQHIVEQAINRIEPLALGCPQNYQHLLLILQGTKACIERDHNRALKAFNQAIKNAKHNGFTQYQALANELAAKACLKGDMHESAEVHLEQAYKLYSLWGAVAKLEHLRNTYPDTHFYVNERSHSDSRSRYIDKSVIDHRIDLKSIMEASLALSSEIEVELVINRMMKVVLESSGAQKALLLLESGSQWSLSAQVCSNDEYQYFSPEQAVSAKDQMPLSVLQFVLRTGKTLHLSDAVNTAPYTNDPYIQTHQGKSIICLPLRHQNKTRAVLYLENNLAKDFFTAEQFQRLTLLSAQMASAIDNSINYQSLSDSERHYRSLLRNLPVAIVVQQQSGLVNYANENAHKLLEFDISMDGNKEKRYVSGNLVDDNGQPFSAKLNPIERAFKSEKPVMNVVLGYQKPESNNTRWFLFSVFPQFSNNKVVNVVACFIDISERIEHEAKIEHLAYFDSLTGLPNRVSLENKLNQVLSSVQQEPKFSAVMMLDLDNFKLINDSLGHAVGDEVLRQVANTLKSTLAEGDFIARLGGDEFIIVTDPFASSRASGILRVEHIAQKIKQAFEQKFSVNGRLLNSGASIGAVLIPEDANTVDEILRRVDAALYQSKHAGRNTLSFFQIEQENKMQRRFELEEDLRAALDSQQFKLLYQPKVNVASGEIIGAEALVRWQHPTKGFISPVEFIPIAEESGLIVPLGQWILHSACQQAKLWQQQPGFSNFKRVAVNVSPVQFNDENFHDSVIQSLTQASLEPQGLDLEITENLLLANTEVVIEKMQQLKDIGVSFSIDDFGTGYSSLAYLKRLPVNTIKIDQSFVRDMTVDPDDKAIVETIIAIAKSLRLNTVAEGVETLEHLTTFQQLSCDEYQGYYFSKPVTAEELEQLVLAQTQ